MTKEQLVELRRFVLDLKNIKDVEKILPHKSAYQFLHECNDHRLDCFAINYYGRKYTFGDLFSKYYR